MGMGPTEYYVWYGMTSHNEIAFQHFSSQLCISFSSWFFTQHPVVIFHRFQHVDASKVVI